MINKKVKSISVMLLMFASIFFIFTPNIVTAIETTDFNNFRPVVIESDNIDSTLTNFPVWFYNVSDDWKINETSFTFLDSDNATECNWELEVFNYTTGTIGAWVNLTSISSSVDTTFYIYYDDANSTDGGENNPEQTWDSNYILVNHMGTDVLDSTSYDNDGASDGTENVTGKTGGARDFVASNTDGITYAASPSLYATGSDLTIEVWVKSDDWTPAPASTQYIEYQNNHMSLLTKHNGTDEILDTWVDIEAIDENPWNCSALAEATWYFIGFNYSDSGDWNNLFVNDELKATISPGEIGRA